MPDYEVMYILNPSLANGEVAEQMARFAQIARDHGAQVGEPKVLGKRRLAYEIRGQTDGTYVLMRMTAEPGAVRELERQLRLAEPVLRHLIVKQEVVAQPTTEKGGQEDVQQSSLGGQGSP